MNTLLKLVAVVCAVGIAAVLGSVLLADSSNEGTPAPTTSVPEAHTSTLETTPEPTMTVAPAPAITSEAEPTEAADTREDTTSPTFRIEELVADCEIKDGFGVSALPLGADWRTTERGVYKNIVVAITCKTGGLSEGLSFEWVADAGEVQGNGDCIVWVAPGKGAKVQVSVMVRDSAGNEEMAALHFRVATCDCVFQRY